MKHLAPDLREADLSLIELFCDALWLEDGLSKNSLTSYRSDLAKFSDWLKKQTASLLDGVDEPTLLRFIAEVSSNRRATSQARYLSTLRRFYRWLMARRQ